MFSAIDVAPNGQPSTQAQNQTQQQLIASVMARQRVIAAQASGGARDASAGDAGSRPSYDPPRRREAPATEAPADKAWPASHRDGTSAAARSIVEAQEAAVNKTIIAAFHMRPGMYDLLSVIRDPEDRVLPKSPEL
jgi:hypothetical protein